MTENQNEDSRVDIDQAWEHNRRQIDRWLKGVSGIVTDAGGDTRTKAEISAALEMGFTLRLAMNPGEIVNVPAMLAILATMYLYGAEPEISDAEMPPMVTTEEATLEEADTPASREARRRSYMQENHGSVDEAGVSALRSLEDMFHSSPMGMPPFELDD